MQQLSLFKTNSHLFHGGALAKKRKTRRPLCSKRPLHIVLKSKQRNLYSHKVFLNKRIEVHAIKSGIKIYSLAINSDHIHFVVKIPNRDSYKRFIRALTGDLGRALGKGLWALIPFTRVLQWGRDFRATLGYLRKNREEVTGVRSYEKRKNWYGRFLSHRGPSKKSRSDTHAPQL